MYLHISPFIKCLSQLYFYVLLIIDRTFIGGIPKYHLLKCTVLCSVCVAPAFPMQGFPNGYPGYPISADSSQPSLTNDLRHSLMGLDDQVRTNTCLYTYTEATKSIWTHKQHCISHNIPNQTNNARTFLQK